MIKDIDIKLKELLSTIKCDGKDVPIRFVTPEEEFVPEEYPSISYFMYDLRYDPERETRQKFIKRDEVGGTAEVRAPAIPYDLFYQIDTWALYAEHDRQLIHGINKLFPPRGHIYVYYAFCANTLDTDMWLEDFRILDVIKGKMRTYRKAFSYVVKADLDEAEKEITKISTELPTIKGSLK